MPIYAYRCATCGHAKDVLQKISDDPLSICPQCASATFSKQLTAAGFQLKGSGWYVTDFRGGNTAAAPAEDAAKTDAAPTDTSAPVSATITAATTAATTAANTPTAAPAVKSAPAATKSVAAGAASTTHSS